MLLHAREQASSQNFPDLGIPKMSQKPRPLVLVAFATIDIGGYGLPAFAGTTMSNSDVLHLDLCIAGFSWLCRAALRLWAVLISAICVSACGKLPVWRARPATSRRR